MSAQAIGIDFGTTKTLVAYLNPRENRPETLRLGRGSDFVPTTAAIDARGQLFFGDEAEDMLEDPSVAYLRGFKMELGSGTPLYMLTQADGSVRHLLAQELVTAFLRRLRLEVQEKVFMGGEVREAVITRPVQFSPARCQALKEAALAAGFSKVILTTEPEAAGLAFCRLNTAEAFKGNALVIDWGGGTLDIALVSRQGDRIVRHSELTDGDMDIGGERFDERLWKHAEAQTGGARLNPVTQMPRVRKAKEQLSSRNSTPLRLSAESGACPPFEVTRELLNSLIAADVDKAAGMVQTLLARIPAEMQPEMLLLVGGSSAIPLIREKLEAATVLPARSWQYSREAVALGAALMINGGQIDREESTKPGKALLAAAKSDTPDTHEPSADVNTQDEAGNTPLHRAAQSGKTDLILTLLEGGADALALNSEGQTPLALANAQNPNSSAAKLLAQTTREKARKRLSARGIAQEEYSKALFRAVNEGDTELIRLLPAAGANINAKDADGKTPLRCAAEGGRTDAVRLLLGIGADVPAALSNGWGELHLAAAGGLTDRVRELLETGADVNARDEAGNTPLYQAASNGHINATRLLLAAGADVNAKNKDGWTPLHWAALQDRTTALPALLEAGADVNAKDDGFGRTPLHRAAYWGCTNVVRLLLEAKSDINAKDKDGDTPLHCAVLEGHADLVPALLEAGADINAKNKVGRTPLHRAASWGHADVVRLLLEAKSDINAKDKDGDTSLHGAASKGLTDTVRLLLEAKADVNAKNHDGDTSLHGAALKGHIDTVRLLLEAKADVNAKDKAGYTPLHGAALKGHTDVARLLLEAGADVNAKDQGGRTLLHRAVLEGLADVVRLLLEAGADVNAKDEDGRTLLHRAVLEGRTGAVRQLLEAKADVNARDKEGSPPLYAAVCGEHADIVRLLLEAGADVNAKDEGNRTLLHRAVEESRTNAVFLLLKAGADAQGTSRWKPTPLDLAIQKGHTECISVLRMFGAKRSRGTSFFGVLRSFFGCLLHFVGRLLGGFGLFGYLFRLLWSLSRLLCDLLGRLLKFLLRLIFKILVYAMIAYGIYWIMSSLFS